MNKAAIRLIFEAFKKANPHPKTELVYHSPFELLVAVLLSAQATDKSVNKATEKLFSVAKTPEAMLALGEEALKNEIKTIGLYNSKAKHLMQTCHILVNQYGGEVPDSREALERLPGVGRKTANVILNTAFHESTIAVDTHIFRVANRTGLARGKTPLAVEKGLEKNIDQEYLKDAHHWLVLHGRYTCVARKPHCDRCIIEAWCEYDKKCL